MNILNIIESATESQDWLFKKMAGRFEGWAIKGEVGSTDVPLNTLDYFAVRVLAQTIDNNSKTVLAVPRITPGVSLSLVSYLTVNRFIANKSKGIDALGLMFDGFKSIHMSPHTPIVVITKNRKLRDYYLSSVLNFGGQVFPFKDFPLFRIKRSADLVPLISNISSPYDLAPVVFYHLDELEDTPRALKGAVVLVELDTLTTHTTLRRLEQFLSSVSPTAVLAVTSTFSTPTLIELRKSGFGLVTLRPENVRNYLDEKENLPSFSSSMAKIPSLAEVHCDLIKSPTVDALIYRLNDQLNEISKTLAPDLPNVFYSARTMLATLRNLAVPLESIEQVRKNSSYLRTIKFLLEKIFTNRYLDLTPGQEAAIMPVWSAIGADFFELYKLLQSSNPKYEYLRDKIISGSLDEDSVVLFYDSIQPIILREELLLRSNKEPHILVRIESLKAVNREGLKAWEVILPGMWQVRDEATVLSSMPNKIKILTYPSELKMLGSSVKRLQDIPIAMSTNSTLESLNIKTDPTHNQEVSYWIDIDEETAELVEQKAIYNKGKVEDGEELPDFYYEAPDDFEGDLIDSDDEDSEEVYIIETENGDKYKIISNRDVLAYSHGSKTVKSVSPDNLDSGDVLLALDGENSKEMFQEIVDRTKDLSGADPEVLTQWERALLTIRRVRDNDGEQLLIDMLRMLQCKKSDTTIRQWIKGVTLAPKDVEDVISLLKIINVSAASELAPLVCLEVDKVRNFHRRLGKRLRSTIGDIARGDDNNNKDLVDIEIDEILDLVHLVKIEGVEGPKKSFSGVKELLVLR